MHLRASVGEGAGAEPTVLHGLREGDPMSDPDTSKSMAAVGTCVHGQAKDIWPHSLHLPSYCPHVQQAIAADCRAYALVAVRSLADAERALGAGPPPRGH